MRTSAPLILSRLIGAHEPLFGHAIQQAEKATRHSGVDVRLISDIYERAHPLLRKLGLNYSNMTAEEAYYGVNGNPREVELFASQLDFVGIIIEDEIVSLNYQDVLANQQQMFSQRSYQAMRKSLASELVSRYRDHPSSHGDSMEEIFMHAGLDWKIK